MVKHVGESTSQTLSNKTLGSDLNAGGYKITNLAAPVNDNDAARKIDTTNAMGSINFVPDYITKFKATGVGTSISSFPYPSPNTTADTKIFLMPKAVYDNNNNYYMTFKIQSNSLTDTFYSVDGANLGNVPIIHSKQNIAKGKTTTPSYPNVNDGNETTYQAFSVSQTTPTERVRIDLNAVYYIYSLSMHYKTTQAAGTANYLKLQVSSDGTNWIDAGSIGPVYNWESYDNHIAVNTNARYVRLLTWITGSGTNEHDIYEILAWTD